MKTKFILYFSILLISMVSITGCQNIFDLDSEQVLFADDNKLDTPNDTVYSVTGIINRMQRIADKTVLIGELRGDLVTLTNSASLELQALANFTADVKNAYNSPQDYYAVINNCNFFIANADTSLKKRNDPVFIKEYAVVKAYRAWTYLQLAQIYGSVPFILEPILTEKQAQADYEKKNIVEISEYFIDDLLPFISTPYPGYGTIGGQNSRKFFIPVRLLLGDLCLWAGRYTESAKYYHDYLTDINSPLPTDVNQATWNANHNTFENWIDSYWSILSQVTAQEIITYIPMEASKFEGLMSDLRNIYNSTIDNDYYYQATLSKSLLNLSMSQSNCIVYMNEATSTRDTLYAPTVNNLSDFYVGDLRLFSVTEKRTVSNSSMSTYSTDRQTIRKINRHVPIYRRGVIYLRYAEALNRAGYPTAAFTVLKHGMTETNISKYVDSTEIKDAAVHGLLTWDKNVFTLNNTLGMHSRGSGVASANKNYVIPSLPTKMDTITFVENLISDEMALEAGFEGYRFYDLMRISMRRNDNSYLAGKIAARDGATAVNQELYNKLLERSNWFLPLK